MSESRVTLKDISQKLKVSPTTVANALKGNPNVSDELRKKIMEKAEEMGYKPNLTAKAMVKNGISIALLLTEEPLEFSQYVRKSITEEVESLSDFKISLTDYAYHDNMSTAEAHDCVERMVQNKYDGIIFGPSFENESYMHLVKKYIMKNPQIKLLGLMNEGIDDAELPYVCKIRVNPETTGRIVAQLIFMTYGKGAKVGVITTSLKYGNHKKTVEVFAAECERYGIEIVDVLQNNDSKIETYNCTEKLLREHGDSMDVIYMTSFDSVQVCRCIENKGLGDRVKVIAHDVYKEMIPYMQNGTLIASIYQNQTELGRTTVRTLFNAIMGEKAENEMIQINPEIVLSSNLDVYVNEQDKL